MRLRLIKIILAILILFILSMLIPIKFCVTTLPENGREEFYIIRSSRTKWRWIVLGDKDGFYDTEITPERYARPTEKGFGISDTFSADLYMGGDDFTTFIVYGKATIDESWDEYYYGDTGDAILYTIDCKKVEIWDKVRSKNLIRNFFPKKYLNIYDYRWFDILRDRLYWYLDGQSNF